MAILALTRLGFGPTASDIAAFEALPGPDLARLTAWVDQQLDPTAIPDAACDARLAASGFSTLNKTLTQLFLDHHVADPDWYERIRPATETELSTWTRAVYSKRQLFEVLVDFWHNHFNVYAWEFIEAPLWVHHDRDVIRAHALGNFRQMLEAVVKSPSMLVYLDNYINFAADLDGNPVGSNENFAREMIELHCLGAENSYGNLPREQVPGYPNSNGYCQQDVVDVARALTGWTFAIDWVQWDCPEGGDNDGHFFYCDEAHDTLPKQVLGTVIPGGGTAASDGHAVLDRLAAHPACGRFIARKLCRRLVGDFPPQSLVDSAAALFTAQWQAPDQIRQVVRHIVLSNEFRTTWGEKVKRPFEIAASALRAGGADFPFTVFLADEDAVNSFHWYFEAGGQALFSWHPPNGYPDVRGAWQSANPRVALWRLVNDRRFLGAADLRPQPRRRRSRRAGRLHGRRPQPDFRAADRHQRLARLHPGPPAHPRRADAHVTRIPLALKSFGKEIPPCVHPRAAASWSAAPPPSPASRGRASTRSPSPRTAAGRAVPAAPTTTRSSSCCSCAAGRTG